MELFTSIFEHALRSGEIIPHFTALEGSVAEVINNKCYQALQKIRAILDDDEIDDPECFYRIEEIVYALEEIGSELGLTRERVRQIKEKAVRRLKQTARSKILKSYLG